MPTLVLSRHLLWVLTGLFLLQFVARHLHQLFISPLRHLSGPKDHHFLLGQTVNQLRSGSPNEPYLSWMRKWPKADLIRYFNVGNSDAVLSPFLKRLVAGIVGMGLVFAEGNEHKKQRRLSGLFSSGHLKALLPVFQDKVHHLSRLLGQIIETEDGVHYHKVFEPAGVGQFLTAINGIFPIRWLPVEASRRFIQANKAIPNQLTDIIHDRIPSVKARKVAGMDAKSGKAGDLLTYLVAENYFAGNGDSDRWSEEDILNQTLSFLAAGHETTAGACVWATQLLIEHPDKPADSGTSLPYLNNFVREVLRLQCPAINIAREAAEDVRIQGTLLRKGTTVVMQQAIVQRNPTIWGPDCDEFNPNRWDHLEGDAPDSWALMTFSQGLRVSISKAMFMLEFKVILIELVSKFDFEAVSPVKMNEIKLINPSALLRPEGGLRVRVNNVAD
ncbi:cytochrome P450 [Immersiella caudata]|uniref:Cytochrome P450 n=1 Tax=Immersiella caudata TaxID=314043 RepID=A0AA40C0X7_9PEZI|nr:cytochrome P450 [Immersiella caudata]